MVKSMAVLPADLGSIPTVLLIEDLVPSLPSMSARHTHGVQKDMQAKYLYM